MCVSLHVAVALGSAAAAAVSKSTALIMSHSLGRQVVGRRKRNLLGPIAVVSSVFILMTFVLIHIELERHDVDVKSSNHLELLGASSEPLKKKPPSSLATMKNSGDNMIFVMTMHRQTNLSQWLQQTLQEEEIKFHNQQKQKNENTPDEKKLVIIIPFRDSPDQRSQGLGREQNLKDWLDYMSKFLSQQKSLKLQNIHILVAEQCQEGIFNKGFLFNAGFVYAMQQLQGGATTSNNDTAVEDGRGSAIDYMIFHDVDQIPTQQCRNCYDYQSETTKLIKTTTRIIDPIKNTAENRTLDINNVGGALLMTPRNFIIVNGYSNRLRGWGREDDNMARRITRKFTTRENKNRKHPGYNIHPVGTFEGLEHSRVMGLDTTEQFTNNKKYHAEVETGLSDLGFNSINTKKTFWVGGDGNDGSGLAVTRVVFEPILPNYDDITL